jgi:putative transposase
MADLRIQLVFSLPGQPRGRGKIERIFGTFNQICLPSLPGYAPRGTKDRAGQARLTLTELDQAIGSFISAVYNRGPHSGTGVAPQARWESSAFIPRMPDSLEQLDLLLLTVAKPRTVHPDGIHFQGLRYLDPVLAAYVREPVTIRYDPRDMAEIRVFHRNRFLCRAICPEHSGRTVSLKDIQAARSARRRALRGQLNNRIATVTDFLPDRTKPPASPAQPQRQSRPPLLTYLEDKP